MSTITYPSPDFPGPPHLALTYPEGWHPLPDVGQSLAVLKEVAEGEFRPNVIVTVRRMVRGVAMQAARAELEQRSATLRDFTLVGEEERLIDGWPGYRMECSYIDEVAGTLVQAIRFAVVDREVGEDIVTITGSCHATQLPDSLEQIRAIQESLAIRLNG